MIGTPSMSSIERPMFLLLIAVFLGAPVATYLITGRWLLAVAAAFVPCLFALLTTPRVCFALFAASLALHYPVLIWGVGLHPYDVAFVVLLLAVSLGYMLRGHTEVRLSRLDAAFLALILATLLSAAFAHDYGMSRTGIFRIIVIYLAFRALLVLVSQVGMRRVLHGFIGLLTLLSLINVREFIATGGAVRVFGTAWLGFEMLSMVAFAAALGLLLWSQSRRERILLSLATIIIVMAILATQSRAPMLAVVLITPIMLFVTYARARRDRDHRALRSYRRFIPLAAAVAVVIIAFSATLFVGMLDRVVEFAQSLGDPKGTVMLRLVLWKAALRSFLENPIVGIGIGNFRLVQEIVPEIRSEPVWYYISGMSTHNVVLQYLSETGLVGLGALLWLAFSGLSMARRNLRRIRDRADTGPAAAALAMMVMFVLTICFMRAWTWAQGGYLLAFIFTLTAALHHDRLKQATDTSQ